jgi:hypothetical protein
MQQMHLELGMKRSCSFDDFASWVQSPSSQTAKKVRHRARGGSNGDPVEAVRSDFEDELRLRAFKEPGPC